MREIEIGSKEYTTVWATDEKGSGNANHKYQIRSQLCETVDDEKRVLTSVKFQNGPIKEYGVNGVHNEDLIAIVLDRLQGFQDGEYGCRENAVAITRLEEALLWLRKRTNDRKNRGVEGTSIK